jgi:hypothetical protein
MSGPIFDPFKNGRLNRDIELLRTSLNMKKKMITIGFVLLSIVLQGYTLDPVSANGFEAPVALRHWLERQYSQWEEYPGLRAAMVRFYEARQFQPAWIGPNGLGPQGRILLKTLDTASNEKLPDVKAYVKCLKTISHNDTQSTSVLSDLSLESLLQAEVNMSRIALDLAFERCIGMGKHRRLLVDRLSDTLSDTLWDALL